MPHPNCWQRCRPYGISRRGEQAGICCRGDIWYTFPYSWLFWWTVGSISQYLLPWHHGNGDFHGWPISGCCWFCCIKVNLRHVPFAIPTIGRLFHGTLDWNVRWLSIGYRIWLDNDSRRLDDFWRKKLLKLRKYSISHLMLCLLMKLRMLKL